MYVVYSCKTGLVCLLEDYLQGRSWMWHSEMYCDFKILEEMFMPRNWYWFWSQNAFYHVL